METEGTKKKGPTVTVPGAKILNLRVETELQMEDGKHVFSNVLSVIFEEDRLRAAANFSKPLEDMGYYRNIGLVISSICKTFEDLEEESSYITEYVKEFYLRAVAVGIEEVVKSAPSVGMRQIDYRHQSEYGNFPEYSFKNMSESYAFDIILNQLFTLFEVRYSKGVLESDKIQEMIIRSMKELVDKVDSFVKKNETGP